MCDLAAMHNRRPGPGFRLYFVYMLVIFLYFCLCCFWFIYVQSVYICPMMGRYGWEDSLIFNRILNGILNPDITKWLMIVFLIPYVQLYNLDSKFVFLCM